MDDIKDRVKKFIVMNGLFDVGDRILLSLSAGKDSVAMLDIILGLKDDLKFEVGAFHLNHMTRGEESDEDENFIKKICSGRSVRLFSESFDFSVNKNCGISFEEQARNKRYSMLATIASENNYNKIATAHSSDDNAETLLYRIFTGTGVHGLCGIRPQRDNIIRPMLCLSSEEIISYNRQMKLEWREDSSNSNQSYSRNYIRKNIIPAVKNKFPDAPDSINRLSENSSEFVEMLDELFFQKFGPFYKKTGTSVSFEEKKFPEWKYLKYAISYAVKKEFKINISYGMLNEISKNILSDSSNQKLYKNSEIFIKRRIINETKHIVIESNDGSETGMDSEWEYFIKVEDIIKKTELKIDGTGLRLEFFFADYEFFKSNCKKNDIIFVNIPDKTDIVTIRNRRNGDRMKFISGTKKIKDYFIEKKLDNKSKNLVPLLVVDFRVAAVMPGLFFNFSNAVSADFIIKSGSEKILAISKKSN